MASIIVAVLCSPAKQDQAIQVADAEGASYVLAQDPDADRFAAAEKKHVSLIIHRCPCSYLLYSADGTWTIFTGDELGALFGAHVLDQHRSSGKPLNKLAIVTSIVSSRMLETMSIVEGFELRDCLTGMMRFQGFVVSLTSRRV